MVKYKDIKFSDEGRSIKGKIYTREFVGILHYDKTYNEWYIIQNTYEGKICSDFSKFEHKYKYSYCIRKENECFWSFEFYYKEEFELYEDVEGSPHSDFRVCVKGKYLNHDKDYFLIAQGDRILYFKHCRKLNNSKTITLSGGNEAVVTSTTVAVVGNSLLNLDDISLIINTMREVHLNK